jgi:hypothetical protein
VVAGNEAFHNMDPAELKIKKLNAIGKTRGSVKPSIKMVKMPTSARNNSLDNKLRE